MTAPADARPYSVASPAETDVSTPVGGAINTAQTMEFLNPVGQVQVVSSDAGDTGTPNVTVTGLDSNGNGLVEIQQPNGLTPVPFTASFAQLLKAQLSAAAIGDIAIEKQVPTHTGNVSAADATSITLDGGAPNGLAGQIVRIDGGTGAGQIRFFITFDDGSKKGLVNRDWDTIPDGSSTFIISQGFYLQSAPFSALQSRRVFYAVAADPTSQKIVYDKFFFQNDHPTDPLTDPFVTMVDPSGKIQFGLAAAINDSVTIIDRLTAPAGVTFSTLQKIVPGGVLAPGDRIAVWTKVTIPAAYVGFIDSTTIFSLGWTL